MLKILVIKDLIVTSIPMIIILMKRLIVSMKTWSELIKAIFLSVFEILRNSSFIMFSIVALGLGTMGIWIGFFPGNSNTPQQIDNLSVFTFCIATLGGIAADYFFEEKNINQNQNTGDELAETVARHGMFFLWSFSVLAAFAALKDDNGISWALGSTCIFWLFINIRKPKFQKIDRLALKNLTVELKAANKVDDEIKGKGL